MAVNPKSLKNLKMFSSTYQPNNKAGTGRPNLLKKYTSQGTRISTEDFTAIVNVLSGMSREKLQEKMEDKKEPTIVVLIGMALLGDIKNKNTKNLDSLMRSIGISPSSGVRNVTPDPETMPDGSVNGGEEQFAVYQYPALPESEVVDSEE